jgi:putative addiction module CopG family antidote
MEVHLTVEQEAFVQEAIESGRFHRAEEAVQQALSLWEKQERNRVQLMAALNEAESDLLAGEYTDHTDETLPLLADELKAEARAIQGRELR